MEKFPDDFHNLLALNIISVSLIHFYDFNTRRSRLQKQLDSYNMLVELETETNEEKTLASQLLPLHVKFFIPFLN